jgi:hypothetical protein
MAAGHDIAITGWVISELTALLPALLALHVVECWQLGLDVDV